MFSSIESVGTGPAHTNPPPTSNNANAKTDRENLTILSFFLFIPFFFFCFLPPLFQDSLLKRGTKGLELKGGYVIPTYTRLLPTYIPTYLPYPVPYKREYGKGIEWGKKGGMENKIKRGLKRNWKKRIVIAMFAVLLFLPS